MGDVFVVGVVLVSERGVVCAPCTSLEARWLTMHIHSHVLVSNLAV